VWQLKWGTDKMMRRRRSPLRYLVPALVVFLILWWVRVWPFRSSPPPPASMPAVGDVVREAYEAQATSFRGKVPLDEFATMFHRMADPDCGGELPRIRTARAVDASGPEHPEAHFRVEYPGVKTDAEYHFTQVEGIWQLQSFTRTPSERPVSGEEATSRAVPPAAASGLAPRPPQPAAAKPSSAAPAASSPEPTTATAVAPHLPASRHYVIQQGDTLSSISRHVYGTTRYWRRILEANPGLRERNLRVGRRIAIPAPPELVPGQDEPDTKPVTPTP